MYGNNKFDVETGVQDGEYATTVTVCDSAIQGTAICHIDGKCSICPVLKKKQVAEKEAENNLK
jgi:hypothetical protein